MAVSSTEHYMRTHFKEVCVYLASHMAYYLTKEIKAEYLCTPEMFPHFQGTPFAVENENLLNQIEALDKEMIRVSGKIDRFKLDLAQDLFSKCMHPQKDDLLNGSTHIVDISIGNVLQGSLRDLAKTHEIPLMAFPKSFRSVLFIDGVSCDKNTLTGAMDMHLENHIEGKQWTLHAEEIVRKHKGVAAFLETVFHKGNPSLVVFKP